MSQKKIKTKIWIDPPSGWRWGFPKSISSEDYAKEGFSVNSWIVKMGYPQSEIDKLGEHFYYRGWETNEDETSI